jgi:hypothetical protein
VVYGYKFAEVLECGGGGRVEIWGCEEFMCGFCDEADGVEDVFCEGGVHVAEVCYFCDFGGCAAGLACIYEEEREFGEAVEWYN